MITADVVRAERAVQTADTTPLSQRYGYKAAASVAQIQAAKQFCESVVKEYEALIDEHFTRLRDIGENPYRNVINYRTEYNYDATLKWATKVAVPAKGELDKKHATAFNGEATTDEIPEVAVLYATIMAEIRAMYGTAGFLVSGPFEDRDGTFMLMRDPTYVKTREEAEAVEAANQRGRLRDTKWYRRLLIALGAKPFVPLALPAPDANEPKQLTGPAIPPVALPGPAAP